MTQIEPKTCVLRLSSGVVEPCPGERCAFWEPGGAVVEGGCLIERLGVDVRHADLAQYLLETRQRLAQERDTYGGGAVRRLDPQTSVIVAEAASRRRLAWRRGY